MKTTRRLLVAAGVIALLAFTVQGQEQATGPKPVLYVVSNSHLDTQWNWTVQDTIRQFLPPTFFDNFDLFERFPDYTFNFEGAIHYMWFKEYHPEAWPELKRHVDGNRWKLAGSWVNAVDTNVPSPESLMRQALYGKRFYRQEFGKVSRDIYLPDCFGFGFALPSIGAHSGLEAFSTQKLSWGAARPAPFAVGLWKGVDGSALVASIRGGDYTARLRSDISTDPKWNQDLVETGGGSKVGFRYFGVGDVGGAPDAESIGWLEKAMSNGTAPVTVRNTSADQLSRDLSPAEKAALPVYEGELLLKTHGVGCYTSQAALKTWNRRNELLADAAERASVAAEWMGGPAYPRDRLRSAWIRFLWHQFHDDLTGTSIPQAYQFSWNDQLLSLNQFSAVLTSAVRAVASGLDTRPEEPSSRARREGVPLVVFNPVAEQRTGPVEAAVQLGAPVPTAVRAVDMETGEEVPAQILSRTGGEARVLLLATVPAAGFKVFDVQRAAAPGRATGLSVTAASLSNERYTVKLNASGDIASIFDKELRLELLKGPARLMLFDNYSPSWPAWEILWDSVSKAPRARVGGPAKVRILERGPVRVALQVTRTAGGSTFTQRIRLARGGDRVEVETDVDWRTPGTLLKASFPLAAASPRATYDLGLGTIERPNATENLYEVPGQQWADVTDETGKYGVAVLNDSKYGWDKPSDNELRLTLLHTPTPRRGFVYQSSNDLGHHRFTYAIAGHAGDWRDGRVPARAARLNQLLLAFQTDAHPGPFGRQLALIQVQPETGQVAVRAVKKAEDSDELVVRVQEIYGRPARGAGVGFASPVLEAREINAAEEPVGPAEIVQGRLAFDLEAYQPRSFALRIAPPQARVADVGSLPIDLPFDLDGTSADGNRADGDFDGGGRTFPAELMPEAIEVNGLKFRLGPSTDGSANVLAARGQRISLPVGPFNRVYVLASAVGGDLTSRIAFERTGSKPTTAPFRVQEWTGAIGQWDSRLVDERMLREVFVPPMKGQSWVREAIEEQMVVGWVPPAQTEKPQPDAAAGQDGSRAAKRQPQAAAPGAGKVTGIEKIRRGWLKRDEVAWVATHLHDRSANQPYIFGYLFKYGFDLPKGTTTLVLPEEANIRIFAVTIANEPAASTRPATFLYAPDLPAPAGKKD